MKKIISLLLGCAVLVSLMSAFQVTSNVAVDKTKMRDLTAYNLVEEIGAGINIGDTLDGSTATNSDETYWGKPKINKTLIQSIKKSGINTVRLPITWKGNMDSNGVPTKARLDRVQ